MDNTYTPKLSKGCITYVCIFSISKTFQLLSQNNTAHHSTMVQSANTYCSHNKLTQQTSFIIVCYTDKKVATVTQFFDTEDFGNLITPMWWKNANCCRYPQKLCYPIQKLRKTQPENFDFVIFFSFFVGHRKKSQNSKVSGHRNAQKLTSLGHTLNWPIFVKHQSIIEVHFITSIIISVWFVV